MSDALMALLVIAPIAGAMAACFFLERDHWNGGVCKESGMRWRHFDTDSQGGRMYTDDQGHYTSVSWPGVDRRA